MKILLMIFFLSLLSNCSFNKNSKFWTEDQPKKAILKNKLKKIINKSNDLLSLSFDEYEIYLDDYNKKSKFPDISK